MARRGPVDRGASTNASKEFAAADAVEHRFDVVAGHRSQTKRDVAHHLDEDTAEAERHQLSEARIVDRADDELEALDHHLLDLDAGDDGIGGERLGRHDDPVVGISDRVSIGEPDDDPACLGLVQDVFGDDLGDDREAQLRRQPGGLLATRCERLGRDGDAVLGAHIAGFRGEQRRAPVGERPRHNGTDCGHRLPPELRLPRSRGPLR